MSISFPTEKDNILFAMDDDYHLSLTDEEYNRLRKLSASQLFLVTVLLARAIKAQKEE